MPYVQWGMECWIPGQTTFDLYIDAPLGFIWLDRITGNFSASASSLCTIVPSSGRCLLRESLNSITFAAAPGMAPPAHTGPAANGKNQGVNMNLLDVIVKQMGTEVVNLPVDVVFDPPVQIPDGHLFMLCDSQTWGPSGLVTDPNEALDTEAQLTVFYHHPQPTGSAFQVGAFQL